LVFTFSEYPEHEQYRRNKTDDSFIVIAGQYNVNAMNWAQTAIAISVMPLPPA
jgi:hypothetical protein